jgi:hypothetical protein
MVRVVKI